MNLVSCRNCGCVIDWDRGDGTHVCPGCRTQINTDGWEHGEIGEFARKEVHDEIQELLPTILQIVDVEGAMLIKPEGILGFNEKMGDLDARMEQLEIDIGRLSK